MFRDWVQCPMFDKKFGIFAQFFAVSGRGYFVGQVHRIWYGIINRPHRRDSRPRLSGRGYEFAGTCIKSRHFLPGVQCKGG